MSDKKTKILISGSAIFLILTGFGLYKLFDYQGYGNREEASKIINYNVNDYIEVLPIVFNNYTAVYTDINVSKINIKNIDKSITKDFESSQEELINYITGYYNKFKDKEDYIPINTVSSNIKSQINGATLSIFYELNFKLDEQEFNDSKRSYFITTNIDLATEKILTPEDILNKFNYNKNYIAEKIFEEDILIGDNEIVIDKSTNISLTKNDVERKKYEYIDRIIDDFDNIIKVYIENNSLVLVYDKAELNNLFFENNLNTDIKIRYLK